MEKNKGYDFKAWFVRNRFLLAAFFISAAIVTLTYIVKGVYPFKNETVLRVDLYHQYAPYIEELHSRILRGRSLLYSWEGGLGKDFVAQMAYYTTSPLNLLMFFFSEKHLPELIALLILLKTSLCSTTFTWYLRSRFRRNDLSILMFGLLFGFCAFMTCYYWNIMWLDSVVLFPLVARGVEADEDDFRLYYIALTLTMIVNFYLAVLICVLISLYYLAVTITRIPSFREKESRRWFLERSVRFGLASLLAALTAMFILAPVGQALSATAVSDTSFPAFKLYPNIYQLVTNHYLGARPAVLARNEDLPNIYSGVVTMILLPAYYFNKGIRRREKILLSVILAFMLACSCIRPLDYLIHGMHFPANLPHRFTFVYSFLLLYMGYRAYQHLNEVKYRYLPIACGFYLAVILLTEFVIVKKVEDIDRVLSNTDIICNIAWMAVYLVLFFFLQKMSGQTGRLSQLLSILLFVCVLGECIFTDISNLEDTGSRDAYIQYMDNAAEAVAYLDEKENGAFYRTEFRRFTTINDASLYHYPGFSQFSSLEPGGISGFMQSLGVAATGNSFRYYDPTPLIDAVFGLKYIMNKDGAHPKAEKYVFDRQFDNVWVYDNPRWLSLGFLVNTDILRWETKDSQPFAVQDDFLACATGQKEKMFELIEPDLVDTQNMTVTPIDSKAHFNYKVDHPENLAAEPTVTVEYTSDRDQYLYLYVDAGNAQRFVYRNNSVNEDRELSAGRSLIDVGHVTKGEKIYVGFKLTKRGAFEKTYRENGTVSLYAARYLDAAYNKAFQKLKENEWKLTTFTDTEVTGIVRAEEEKILFTSIPYIRGWEITVDGKKTEKLSIGDEGVIGIRIPAGDHVVTMTYRQRILLPAVLLSVLGVILFVFFERWCRRHPARREN